jgi:DNA-binding IclR family transcriptional regulator
VRGVTDLSAPIIGETGWAVGALTVPFILRDDQHTGLEDAIPVVMREAAAISADLAVGMPGHATNAGD